MNRINLSQRHGKVATTEEEEERDQEGLKSVSIVWVLIILSMQLPAVIALENNEYENTIPDYFNIIIVKDAGGQEGKSER